MIDHEAERDKIIAVARSWIGTPFHDGARLKGIGVDCAMLLAGVWEEAGLIPRQQIEPYSPQFMLHRDDPLFENFVRKFARQVESPQRADIVLYKVGRSFSHGAIVVEWPGAIIHAFKNFRFVAETHSDEATLRGLPRKFFSFW